MEVDEVSTEVVLHATAEAVLPVPREHQNEMVPLDSRIDTSEDDMELDKDDTAVLATTKSLGTPRQTRSQTQRNEHIEPGRSALSAKQPRQIKGARKLIP